MTAFIVFAKAPVPGTVKTRLAPALDSAAAADLHRELVMRTLSVTAGVTEARGDVELCCAPDSAHPFFAACAARFGVTLTEQGGGDLGARMARALARGIDRAGRAVLIGTDCPVIDAAYLRRAAQRLEAGAEIVLGPAEDGGYVLVGASRVVPAMFDAMQWGVATVLATTRARLRTSEITPAELNVLWDVDRPEDYDRYRQLVAATPRSASS